MDSQFKALVKKYPDLKKYLILWNMSEELKEENFLEAAIKYHILIQMNRKLIRIKQKIK